MGMMSLAIAAITPGLMAVFITVDSWSPILGLFDVAMVYWSLTIDAATVGRKELVPVSEEDPYAFVNVEKLRAHLADAGLHDVRVDTESWEMEIHSGEHLWDVVVNSNPIARTMVADLTQEEVTEVQRDLDAELRDRSGGSGPAVLTNRMHVAIGTK